LLKIKINRDYVELLKGIDLAELCITSSVEISNENSEDIEVQTIKAEGNKCPVCWKISKQPCLRHGV